MQLQSLQCDGLLAERLIHVEPTDADYQETLRRPGDIRRRETKPICREGSATLADAAQRQCNAQALVGAGSLRL
jgi:hypothetical protein